MRRRQFLAYGAAAIAGALATGQAAAQSQVQIALRIEPVDAEMIDGEVVFMLLFFSAGSARPVIRVTEGQSVQVTVYNNDTRAHGFAIAGVPGASINSIAAGRSRSVSFTAPRGGTYLYYDPTRAPIYRVLGLHGAFVVAPLNPNTPAGAPTPFSVAAQTPAVQSLFDALGAPGRFPGRRWSVGRDRVWVFSQTDPALNRSIDANLAINANTVAANFAPRYFTLNGLSGFDAAHDESTRPTGYVGEPLVLRVLNAGLATHAPHIHGNHVMELSGVNSSGAQVVSDNIVERDTWIMAPFDRKDLLLPFERPPDIPSAAYPLREEPFPLRYPMHCHTEMSQTAGGGNYPQGLVTDWEILGPVLPAGA